MFEVSQCPTHHSILSWIEGQIGGWPQLPKRFEPQLTLPGFSYNQSRLAAQCKELGSEIGFVAWRSTAGGALIGMSTHYDPQLPASEMYVGSFGHPRYQTAGVVDYYKLPARELPQASRADYLDILGFRKLCPAVADKHEFMKLLAGFTVPVVRGTIRVIDGAKAFSTQSNTAGMHVDADPSKAMRINLSVQTSDDFGLQYEGYPPLFTTSGAHRIVCTDFKHRAWVRKQCNFQRIHVVFDVLPWLKYDAGRDAYSLNEFFDMKHPYDMVADGDVWRAH